MPTTDPRQTRARESASVDSAIARINELLVPGETLEAYAVQRRFFALLHRRIVVGATSGRLIVLSRGLFGGFDVRDVRWQDLKDANLRVGILGATLRVAALTSSDLAMGGLSTPVTAIAGLRKQQAQKVYTICQTHEQEWREKRRIREIEELRAKSGGITLGSGLSSPGESESTVARLERAKEMLNRGLITDAEYEAIKARLVSTL